MADILSHKIDQPISSLINHKGEKVQIPNPSITFSEDTKDIK